MSISWFGVTVMVHGRCIVGSKLCVDRSVGGWKDRAGSGLGWVKAGSHYGSKLRLTDSATQQCRRMLPGARMSSSVLLMLACLAKMHPAG